MTDWNRIREIQNLRESGRPAEALAAFKAAREDAADAKDKSSILLHESLCYRDLGQFNRAAEAASKAIRLLPQESPSRPYAEFSLACIHEGEGKFDLAAEEFKILLKTHADLLNIREYIHFRRNVQLRLIADLIVLGRSIESLSIADSLKAEDISPQEAAELSYREAQAHRLLGRQDRALKLYEEAISGPLERSLAARAHFHIGEFLYDRSEFSQALDEFKNAEELSDASNPDRELFTEWVNHTLRTLTNCEPDLAE